MMNVPLLVAGALAVGTGIIHIYLMERYYRLLRPDDLPNTRLGSGAAFKSLLRGISALWGVSWWSAAALFFIFADGTLGGDAETTVRVLASTFALYAVVILARFGFRHRGGFALAAIAIAAWGGTL